MKPTKKSISLSEDGHQVIVKEEGMELQREQRTVGTRTIIDVYEKKEIHNIQDVLKKEIENFKKGKADMEKKIEQLSKQFNLRERNKIKELLALQKKAGAYAELQKAKAQIENFKIAIERDEKDLKELSAI